MSSEENSIKQKLFSTGAALVENRVKYKVEELKIAGIQKGSKIGATTIVSILLLVAFLLTWFFGMLALCYYLAEDQGLGAARGFGYVAAGHAVFLLILLLFKGLMTRFFSFVIAYTINK